MIPALRSFLRRASGDQSGVSAVEFALIAPVMVLFYLGMMEVSLALSVDRKVTAAASALADLVAQDDVVTDDEMENILNAGAAIIAPNDPARFSVRITSVSMNLTGDVEVDWSDASGMTPLAPGSAVATPGGILFPGRSVIMVEVNYLYDAPFAEIGLGQYDIDETFYLRPRQSLVVSRG
ncbi:TadE/TadG family type IV pilus assembly protein [Hyphobacterium marinum]|uniref:TadE/TadG family type IV pilus assembly protein n=1 Tax=Hyphobacterium marinum TaxID=3116574 RepID=A0ABU7LWD4_9PROT|nr:TadE/TadG family type IV pilus assembly protein [Hyphobacterium sp. Y6023]MEE2565786.1 TadE/TadG family type IV pilus assembly protein [Hyphobacterium sp. Y6023]